MLDVLGGANILFATHAYYSTGPGIIIIREIDYNAIKKINKIRALGRGGEERRRLPVQKERDFE